MNLKYFVLLASFAGLGWGCGQEPAASAAPQPQTPHDAAMTYITDLQQGKCDEALSLVSGELRSTYDKMVSSRGLDEACDAWKQAYTPAIKTVYGYETTEGEKTTVWVRLFRAFDAFEPVSITVEKVEGVWRVVGV